MTELLLSCIVVLQLIQILLTNDIRPSRKQEIQSPVRTHATHSIEDGTGTASRAAVTDNALHVRIIK